MIDRGLFLGRKELEARALSANLSRHRNCRAVRQLWSPPLLLPSPLPEQHDASRAPDSWGSGRTGSPVFGRIQAERRPSLLISRAS